MFRLRHPLHRPERPGADVPPLEPGARHSRLRRGGPRTPIPLLPVIAAAAGIGIAYVSQVAGATQTSYQVTTLQQQQQQLQVQDQQLGDMLAQLQSSERIVAAAQAMGMQPADNWTAVVAKPVQILPSAQPQQAAHEQPGALQQLLVALSGISMSGVSQP